jgi:ADP-ribose pyrophosphatase YjhB (NUDIX family)
MKPATLCFLIKENKILLAMKKRGFGAGKWNGVGGKIEENETIKEAAAREMREEINVSTHPDHLKNVGNIKFYFKNKPDWDMHVHIFFTKTWEGEPRESEEMRPQWYKHTEIPYEKMWIDDTFWLPQVLAGKKIEGKFYFNEDGSKFDKHTVNEI